MSHPVSVLIYMMYFLRIWGKRKRKQVYLQAAGIQGSTLLLEFDRRNIGRSPQVLDIQLFPTF